MGGDSCDLAVEKYKFSSPIGCITVSACLQGLHEMSQESGLSDENFSPNIVTGVKPIGIKEADLTDVMMVCYTWLKVYFEDVTRVTQIPRPDICALKKKNLAFRPRVWQMLADTVGPGEVISYGVLAAKLGNPGAVRAVGSAMKNNPICIIVPCHRVVRANDLGLYHGGTRQSVKRWLLKHEGLDKY